MQADRDRARSAQGVNPQSLASRSSPIQSPIAWAVLGLVIAKPDHGYALMGRLEEELRGLLPLRDPSYVYRALEALEERGFVEVLPDTTTRGVRRTRFRATAQGECAYQDHLVAEIERFLVDGQTFFLALAALADWPEGALEVIERAEAACVADQPSRALSEPREEQAERERRLLADRLHLQGRRQLLSATAALLAQARRAIEEHAARGSSA